MILPEASGAALASEGAKGAGSLAAGEGILGAGDAILSDALLGPALFDATGAAGLSAIPGLMDVAPIFNLAGTGAGAVSSLPFGLTTSDLAQGGLRLGQSLLENNAYSSASDRAKSIQEQMRQDQRGYTDRAVNTVNDIAELYDPQQFNADYGAEADKAEKSLADAVMAASADKPAVMRSGDASDRYASVSSQRQGSENQRIARIADLLGNLGATRNLAQRRSINTVPFTTELGNIGSDRGAAHNLGLEALMGVEPSGGQLMAASLLGAGADAMSNLRRRNSPSSTRSGSIFSS